MYRQDPAPLDAAHRPGPARGSFRRFLLVGGTCTTFQYLLLALLVDGLGTWPVLATAVSYACAVVLNYELSRRFTFFGRDAALGSFLRFVTVSVIGLTLNTLIFATALRLGAPHYLVAQVIATGTVMLVNFTLYRLWAFRE